MANSANITLSNLMHPVWTFILGVIESTQEYVRGDTLFVIRCEVVGNVGFQQ